MGLSTTDEPLKAWVDKTSIAAGVRIVEAADGGGGSTSAEVGAEDADTGAVGVAAEESEVAQDAAVAEVAEEVSV